MGLKLKILFYIQVTCEKGVGFKNEMQFNINWLFGKWIVETRFNIATDQKNKQIRKSKKLAKKKLSGMAKMNSLAWLFNYEIQKAEMSQKSSVI